MKKSLIRILTHTCVCFTVTVFLILLVYLILNKDLSAGMNPAALALILPFSLCFSLGNFLLRHATFNAALRVLCHAVLTLGGIWLFLVLPNREPGAGASGALAFFAVLAIVYALVMAVILGISARVRRVKRDTGEYRKVYKK